MHVSGRLKRGKTNTNKEKEAETGRVPVVCGCRELSFLLFVVRKVGFISHAASTRRTSAGSLGSECSTPGFG
jgi:hypothetical protein